MKNLKPNLDASVLILTMQNRVYSKRVCYRCGREKDTYGGKECDRGHFNCHSCAGNHAHCGCGRSLR